MKLTGDRCRCSGCGEYFNRSSTFTAHRVGPYAPINRPNTRRCLTVAEMQAKGWRLNAAGFWITAKRLASTHASRVETAIGKGRCLTATPAHQPPEGPAHGI